MSGGGVDEGGEYSLFQKCLLNLKPWKKSKVSSITRYSTTKTNPQ